MFLLDVSSPFVVPGSDKDLELVMPTWAWHCLTALLSWLGIGQWKRIFTYRVEMGNVEIFIIAIECMDKVTQDMHYNFVVMRNWKQDRRIDYVTQKGAIAHLTGKERKRAKGELARAFRLKSSVYGV